MPSTICQSYAHICKRYNLGNGGTEAMQILAMQWMEELTEEWLMIFDDCNLADRRGHLPGRGKGNIIYTSRLTSLKHGLPADCVFEIKPFGIPDAVELLQKASGFQGDPTNHPEAKDIVKELGCLPLAIDKAAASIRDGMTLDNYLRNLRTRKVGLLHDPRFKDRNVENPTVYAALELSHTAIEARRRRGGRQFAGRSAMVALKLLGVLCFYHYNKFPLAVLERAAKERSKCKADLVYPLSNIMEPPDSDLDFMLDVNADGSWDMTWVSVGLKVLETFSLVQCDRKTSTVSMHILVHSWARHRMEQEMYLRYCLVAKIILSESIVISWRWLDKAFSRSMGPHASVCLVRRSKTLQYDEYEAELQIKRGWMYELNKQFDDAEREFLRCLRFWKVERGNDSSRVISTLERLGALYHDMGRLGDSEMVYLEAINKLRTRITNCEAATETMEEPEQKAVPQEPSSEIRSSHSAEPLPQKPPQARGRSSKTFRRLLGNSRDGFSKGKGVVQPTDPNPPQPERITAETNLEEASDELNKLRLIWNFVHGRLAKVYMDQDRYGMGKRMLLQVAENLESLLIEDAPELLRLQNDARSITTPGDSEFWAKRLSHWCDLMNDPENGNDYMESEVGWQLMVAHADCELKNKMYDEAYQQYCAARKIYERIYGPYDKRILEILRRMVVCKVEAEDGDLAVEIARECLSRARRVYGECHRETVLALEKLHEARFFQRLESDDEGQKILREALARAEEALGLTHSITSRIRSRLQLLTQDEKKPEQLTYPTRFTVNPTSMEEAWKKSKVELKVMKTKFGEDHIMVKRFARYVRDGPAKTPEEHLERILACWGPDSSLAKLFQKVIEDRKQAALAEAKEQDGEACPTEPRRRGPDIYLCACGELEHAEGSWQNEAHESEAALPGTREGDVRDGGDGEGPQPAAQDTLQGLEEVLQAAKDPDFLSEMEDYNKDRWLNRPVYFAGMY